MDDVPDGRHDGQWIGCCPHDEIRRPPANKISVKRRFGIEPKLMHVADDAYDRKPARFGVERTKIDSLSDRIALWPVAPRHYLIDEQVENLPVVRLKGAACAQRNSQRRKVT